MTARAIIYRAQRKALQDELDVFAIDLPERVSHDEARRISAWLRWKRRILRQKLGLEDNFQPLEVVPRIYK